VDAVPGAVVAVAAAVAPDGVAVVVVPDAGVVAADGVVVAADAGVAITVVADGSPAVTSGAAPGSRWRGRGATRSGAADACTVLIIIIEQPD
jgi:hypothetical protein